ncbi:MAG: fibronectin type III domain-containing protein, partial [Bacteroidia bacterium]|nr:fibronectin type III domain-containing protein [Bacteroidia bacterium]
MMSDYANPGSLGDTLYFLIGDGSWWSIDKRAALSNNLGEYYTYTTTNINLSQWAGQTVTFDIWAYTANDGHWTKFSIDNVQLTINYCIPPPIPTGLTATTISDTQINLTWNPSAGANNYLIYYDNDACGSPWLYFAQSTTTSKAITGLSPGTTYYFAIQASNGSCVSNQCNCISQSTSTSCITPGTPTSNTPTGISTNGANFSWSAGSPVGSPTVTYFWSVGTNSSVTYESGYTDRGTTIGTTAITSLLNSNTTYYFRVKACTSCDGTCSG